MFEADGSLKCSRGTCTAQVSAGSTNDETVQHALAARWGVWDGLNGAGEPMALVICPDCRGYARKRPARRVQDFEDTPLFEEM